MRGNVAQHDRSASDPCSLADHYIPENLSPHSNGHLWLEGGVALTSRFSGSTEGHALIQRAVVAHNRSFANDDSHAMINEHALTDACAGMDLDTGEEPAKVADEARGQEALPLEEPVR
jgi:hypothetical protein